MYSTHKLIFEPCPSLCQMCGSSISASAHSAVYFIESLEQIVVTLDVKKRLALTSTGICLKHEMP